MRNNLSFFFYDVEDGELYELTKQKQFGLLKNHPNWLFYDLENPLLQDALNYFKTHGKLVASTRSRNIFAGFTA